MPSTQPFPILSLAQGIPGGPQPSWVPYPENQPGRRNEWPLWMAFRVVHHHRPSPCFGEPRTRFRMATRPSLQHRFASLRGALQAAPRCRTASGRGKNHDGGIVFSSPGQCMGSMVHEDDHAPGEASHNMPLPFHEHHRPGIHPQTSRIRVGKRVNVVNHPRYQLSGWVQNINHLPSKSAPDDSGNSENCFLHQSNCFLALS